MKIPDYREASCCVNCQFLRKSCGEYDWCCKYEMVIDLGYVCSGYKQEDCNIIKSPKNNSMNSVSSVAKKK